MPLYEYRCHKCGNVFEVIQKFSDTPLATHAECGGEVERLISASAFQFKGSGFYITDYAKGNKGAPAAKSGDGSKSESGKSSDSSSPSSDLSSSDNASPGSTTTSTTTTPATTTTTTKKD